MNAYKLYTTTYYYLYNIIFQKLTLNVNQFFVDVSKFMFIQDHLLPENSSGLSFIIIYSVRDSTTYMKIYRRLILLKKRKINNKRMTTH